MWHVRDTLILSNLGLTTPCYVLTSLLFIFSISFNSVNK